MPTVNELTSSAIASLIEAYKPVGNRLDTMESAIGNLSGLQVNILDFPRIAPEVDDTGRFNRAISKVTNDPNYSKQFWRTPIKLAPGRYTLKNINLDGARVAVVGSGIEGCVIEPAAGASYIFKIDNTTTAGSATVEGIRFSSFLPSGLGGTWTGVGIVLGQVNNYNEGEIKNCWFSLGDLAIAISGRAWDSRIHNCWFDSNNIGIQLTGDSHRVKIDQCSFWNNKVNDIYFKLSAATVSFAGNGYHRVTGCSFIGGEDFANNKSTCSAITAEYAQNLKIINCDFNTPYSAPNGIPYQKAINLFGCSNVSVNEVDLMDTSSANTEQIILQLCTGVVDIDKVRIVGGANDLIACTNTPNINLTLNISDVELRNAQLQAINVIGQAGSSITVNLENVVVDKANKIGIIAGDSGLGLARLTMRNVTVTNSHTAQSINGEGVRALARSGYIENCYFENTNGKQQPHIKTMNGMLNFFIHRNDLRATSGDGPKISTSSGDPTFIIEQNFGYKTENSGIAGFNGDGTTKNFVIPHGLISAPGKWFVTSNTANAAGIASVTADATNLYVNYSTAPPAGTNNLILIWEAEVES